jgi:hypothetical protein
VGVSGQIGSSQFSVAQSTCGGTLAAGASCTVGVTFAPTSTGATTGVLTFASTAITTPATVSLSGIGAAGAAIGVTPGSIVFATTGVGTVSTQTLVTVTNTGNSQSLNNLALAVSTGFVLVNNACGATLGPGLSCTAGVEFAPTTGGPQTGNLTVTSSTITTSASVPLSGAGLVFTLTVSGSSSQTVSAGQTASYALVITPLNGSLGTFSLACGTLPANTVCTFNPTTETLGSGVIGNVTMELSTGGVGTLVRPGNPLAWRLVPLVCGLVLLPLGWRRRRRVLMLAALLAIVGAGVASCTSSGGGTGGSGGGSGGSGGSGSTPAGTYSITASAASGGVEQSVVLTLTVD